MNGTRSYEQQQGGMESTNPLPALIDFMDLDLHDKCAIPTKSCSMAALCAAGLWCVMPRKKRDVN